MYPVLLEAYVCTQMRVYLLSQKGYRGERREKERDRGRGRDDSVEIITTTRVWRLEGYLNTRQAQAAHANH